MGGKTHFPQARSNSGDKQSNLSQLNISKVKDSAGVSGGLSSLSPLNPQATAPTLSDNSTSPGFSEERIATNPSRDSAKKNGLGFEIC